MKSFSLACNDKKIICFLKKLNKISIWDFFKEMGGKLYDIDITSVISETNN